MRTDTQSYRLHDSDYKTVFNLENSKKRIEEYEEQNLFAKNGFRDAIKRLPQQINTHIDIGCGTGWLLLKTAPHFRRVIGIDPSENGTAIARELTKNLPNVEIITQDMLNGLSSLHLDAPVFITTAVVLSHIKDFYVKDFLKKLNALPYGSALFFNEPYGVNVQQNMWHVRSMQWWADNLYEWDLHFEGRNGLYPNGIYGEKVGMNNRKKTYIMSTHDKVSWSINGISNKIKRIGRGIHRLIVRK